MSDKTIDTAHKVLVTAFPKTGEDPARDANVDFPPTWQQVTGPEDIVLSVAEDGLSAVITPGLLGGAASFVISAISGGISVNRSFFIDVTAVPAERIDLTFVVEPK